jgi:hypothetical protein
MKSADMISACKNMVKLMTLHRRQGELMKQMVFAIAVEYLKRNGISKTLDDWAETNAALEMWMGETHTYTPKYSGFVPRSIWPTHLRLWDLKPVRVRPYKVDTKEVIVREVVGGKVLAKVTPNILEVEYVRIREEDGRKP